MKKPNLKTWVEIDKKAILSNIKTIRRVLKKKPKLYAVVKSNAYGHALREFSLIANSRVDGFCVDSVYEGETLRDIKIKKPIIVLGPTLTRFDFELAVKNNLEITISTFESLKQISRAKKSPDFYIKVDTGMHRQGFFVKDSKKVIDFIKKKGLRDNLKGVYTHFASAKDVGYPDYTNRQIEEFKTVRKMFQKAGFKKILFSACATGGAILYPQTHFDMVRIGIGLYGYWPSKESLVQHTLITKKDLLLKSALSWKTKVSEVKRLKKGNFVGYDLSEKLKKDTTVAIVPIGYWHGLSMSFSRKGQMLIRGKRCRIIGRVSMDLTIVECDGGDIKIGDTVTIIGKSKNEKLSADDLAETAGTINYEILTTINPFIKRKVV
ncbi:MAG: alanine racemase [Candidatus Pacebacteria bacterium]|jgi:alanine racemase|nr:alanine racemase [Candidatus Paceibacterota bacterium]|tara:strand:- start:44313 stop:45449 length:1137 start_codon:yes stop_codon:yes gene_type:complete